MKKSKIEINIANLILLITMLAAYFILQNNATELYKCGFLEYYDYIDIINDIKEWLQK